MAQRARVSCDWAEKEEQELQEEKWEKEEEEKGQIFERIGYVVFSL